MVGSSAVKKFADVSKVVKQQFIKNFALVSHDDDREEKEWLEMEDEFHPDHRRRSSRDWDGSREGSNPPYLGRRDLSASFIGRSKSGYEHLIS